MSTISHKQKYDLCLYFMGDQEVESNGMPNIFWQYRASACAIHCLFQNEVMKVDSKPSGCSTSSGGTFDK